MPIKQNSRVRYLPSHDRMVGTALYEYTDNSGEVCWMIKWDGGWLQGVPAQNIQRIS